MACATPPRLTEQSADPELGVSGQRARYRPQQSESGPVLEPYISKKQPTLGLKNCRVSCEGPSAHLYLYLCPDLLSPPLTLLPPVTRLVPCLMLPQPLNPITIPSPSLILSRGLFRIPSQTVCLLIWLPIWLRHPYPYQYPYAYPYHYPCHHSHVALKALSLLDRPLHNIQPRTLPRVRSDTG